MVADRGRKVARVVLPRIERRAVCQGSSPSSLSHTPSKVGFVHLFRPLATNQLQRVIEHKWSQLGLAFCPTAAADAEALAAIMRITQGNFRLIERLFTQIERLLAINELRTITSAVIDAARESLVIGAQ